MMLLLTILVLSLLCLAVFRRTTCLAARAPAAQPTIEVSDAAVAHRALVDYADVFSDRPFVPFPVALVTGPRRRRSDNLNSVPYGPLWRVLRCNLTADILHPSRLSLLAPLQHKAIEALIDDIAARGAGEVVVREVVHAAVFKLVARLCFGDGIGECQVRSLQRMLQEFVRDVGEADVFAASRLARLLHWRRQRRFRSSRSRQGELYLPLIDARRQTQRQDANGGMFRPCVDSLIDLRFPSRDDAGGEVREENHPDRALTDDEMVSLLLEFLVSGKESVVACVEWTLGHLVNEPEVQTNMRREVIDGDGDSLGVARGSTPYLRAVILESLHLHPPVPFVIREVGAAKVLDELAMPAGGARVHFVIGDIERDGKAWSDPDEFRPERFLAGGEAESVGPLPGPKEMRMMPFGGGRRFCQGMGLGMVHIGCFLAALVRELNRKTGYNTSFNY